MYNKFSTLYDTLVFDIDYDKYANNILEILKNNNIESGQILEIACGTGNITKYLAKSKHNILAFDFSEDMLNQAYPKLIDYENINLIKYDMYKFPYEMYEFDAIITLLDVINYIIDPKKIKELFFNIFNGLKDGGVFIFDLNSKNKLFNVLGDNHFIYEKENIFYTWESSRDRNLINFELNFFVKDIKTRLYERITERQVERYYSIEFIIGLLEEVGFTNIEYKDEDKDIYNPQKTQRILFSCLKHCN